MECRALGREYHVPVMLDEVLECFAPILGKNATIVDATAGGMGHSKAISTRLENGRLICIDQDECARGEFEKAGMANAVFIKDNFSNIKGILEGVLGEKRGVSGDYQGKIGGQNGGVDGVLADLGVSSFQIDTAERGFSYTVDGALDMRMNQDQKRDAYHVVNHYTLERLVEIIREYGEERHAKSIATAIVKHRPIKTTKELVKVITDATPNNYYLTGGHPAKRTFQAIRIEVNRELEILENFVRDAVDCLKPNGRIAIITFHSLEDRIVKQTMRELATECICPPKSPKCICGHRATLQIINKKPVVASEREVATNPRAASAKLRMGVRL